MSSPLGLHALTKLQEKIDARVMRERVLIFLSATALVFMVWNFIIQAPVSNQVQEAEAQLSALATQRTAMETQITAATQALLNDPDRQKKLQIKQLETDIAELEVQLQNKSQTLVKADELPKLLQDVLQKTTQLNLLEVATLPMQELHFITTNGALEVSETKPNYDNKFASQSQENDRVGVYEHAVELRVAGNYFQVIRFLTALEALPWRFYWQRLDYKVTEYPNAEIILRVYTLSSEEGLLGV